MFGCSICNEPWHHASLHWDCDSGQITSGNLTSMCVIMRPSLTVITKTITFTHTSMDTDPKRHRVITLDVTRAGKSRPGVSCMWQLLGGNLKRLSPRTTHMSEIVRTTVLATLNTTHMWIQLIPWLHIQMQLCTRQFHAAWFVSDQLRFLLNV